MGKLERERGADEVLRGGGRRGEEEEERVGLPHLLTPVMSVSATLGLS